MNDFNTEIANSQELSVSSPPDQPILDSYFSFENTVLDRDPTSLEEKGISVLDSEKGESGRDVLVQILQDYGEYLERESLPEHVDSSNLCVIPGVALKMASALNGAGYETVGDVAEAKVDELIEIDGIGKKLALRWIKSAQGLIEPSALEEVQKKYVADLKRMVENFRDCGIDMFRLECGDKQCGGAKIIPKRCKLRICPKCAIARKIRYQEKYGGFLDWGVDHGHIDRDEVSFITLTLRNVEDLRDGKIKIQQYFKKLRLEVYPDKIRGGWVAYESHPDGEGKHNIHLHAEAWMGFIKQEELSAEWGKITGGSDVVWIERIDPTEEEFGKSAINYILKYCLKGLDLEYNQLLDIMGDYQPTDSLSFSKSDWENFYVYDSALDTESKHRKKKPVKWSVVDIADYMVSLRKMRMVQPFGEFCARKIDGVPKTLYARYLADDSVTRDSHSLVCPSCNSDKFWLVHCYEKDISGEYLRFKSQALAVADALVDSGLGLNVSSSGDDEKDEFGNWQLSPSTALKLLKAERDMMSQYHHQGGADQWEALKAIERKGNVVNVDSMEPSEKLHEVSAYQATEKQVAT